MGHETTTHPCQHRPAARAGLCSSAWAVPGIASPLFDVRGATDDAPPTARRGGHGRGHRCARAGHAGGAGNGRTRAASDHPRSNDGFGTPYPTRSPVTCAPRLDASPARSTRRTREPSSAPPRRTRPVLGRPSPGKRRPPPRQAPAVPVRRHQRHIRAAQPHLDSGKGAAVSQAAALAQGRRWTLLAAVQTTTETQERRTRHRTGRRTDATNRLTGRTSPAPLEAPLFAGIGASASLLLGERP